MYVNLTFKSWKKILKIFFSSCHNVNFRKKHILAIFRIIFQKYWHNSWRHHLYSCNFEMRPTGAWSDKNIPGQTGLTIFHTEKHLKIRKEHVLIKVRLYHIFYTVKIWQKPYSIKSVYRVRKKMFADVLQSSCSWSFCKSHGKTLVLEPLFKKVGGIKRVHHKCFPMKYFF